MNSALTVEDRRSGDRELIAYYLERLALAGGPELAFDDAWNEYRRHCFYPQSQVVSAMRLRSFIEEGG